MNEQKKYTAADIERYHLGKMTAAERHALEKAALHDAFLADAVEGYAAAPTPAADLQTLQQKLQQRMQKEKGQRRFFFMNNGWLKAAAIFVLVAGAGWFYFQTRSHEETKTDSYEALQKKAANINTNPVTDSTTVVMSEPAKTPPLKMETKKEYKELAPLAKVKGRRQTMPAENKTPAVVATPGMQANLDSAVVMGYGRLRATAQPQPKNETFFNKAYNDAEKDKREVAKVTDTIKNFNVTLNRSNDGLQEIVLAQKRAAPVRRMNVTIDSLEPEKGWTNFDDYVAAHLQEPDELKEKGLRGEVELSFDVNKEGEPTNIAVTQSLCKSCDEEAVRLLKQGPKWKKNKKSGKIKIKFPLPPQQ